MGFNKNLLLLIVSLSSLVLSTHASIAPFPSQTLTVDSIFKKALEATRHAFDPELVDFCKDTENPSLCVESIAPNLDSFEPIKALETEIEATLNQSMKVGDMIAESLKDPNTDKNALDALDICKSQYESIVDAIKEAVELLNQQNVVDAYYKFSSVISYRTSCEDAFLESPGVDIPFPDDSLAVYQLGGNCLAIMDGMVNSPRNNLFLF